MNVFFILVGIALVIAGIVITIIKNAKENIRDYYGTPEESQKKSKRNKWIAMIIAGVLIFVLGCSFVIIPTGHTGVRTTFGQVSDKPVPKGFNFKAPFVQKIAQVNNKQQDATIDAMVWGETKEKTPVYATDIVVTYQISPERSAWLYTNVTNVSNLMDNKLVASSIKSAMVELDADNVTSRSKIEPLTQEKLNASLAGKYGEGTVTVIKVVINDMDFEEEYNQAIAKKSVAQRDQEAKAIENQTAIEEAEADKKVAILNAEAKAEALRIETEAEAKANELLKQTLTDAILREMFLNKWDGKLPLVSGSDGTMIDIDSLLGE